MVATGSSAPYSANISSGTSVNLTVVLEKPMNDYYEEIDVQATPDGNTAIVVHANNCTTEINEWVSTFGEVLKLFDVQVNKGEIFEKLFMHSLNSDENVGQIVSYNYLASEPIAGVNKGTPFVMRAPEGEMNLANFMQSQIYSAVATMALGMEVLKKENVRIDNVLAHGGFYKTNFIGQNATSAVLNAPVSVMQTASEGGAWGMALLTLYMLKGEGTLAQFLDKIFANMQKTTVMADENEKKKWAKFFALYRRGLATAKKAGETW
jgi:sugar (pentulose or hexulose) kinase